MRVFDQLVASEWVRGFKPVSCGSHDCRRWLTERQLAVRSVGVTVGDTWYCSYRCARPFVEMALGKLTLPASQRNTTPRISLGLTLLRQALLTEHQYKATVEMQRETREDFGELAARLGFITESELTEARAQHWGCPVFSRVPKLCGEVVQIPLRLRSAYSMVPLHYMPAGNRLFVGFQYGIEYGPLFAMEQILGCTTQPCLVSPSDYHAANLAATQKYAVEERSFDGVYAASEMARIVCEIGRTTDAVRIALARCGDMLWCRLNGAKINDVIFSVS